MLLQEKDTTRLVTETVEQYYDTLITSLPRIVLGIFIVIAGVLIAQLIASFFRKRFLKRTDDPLMVRFLSRSIKLVLIAIAAMLALKAAGLDGVATGILTAVGGGAIVLGFAFQDIGKNFLAGIILAFNRPFNINDTIMIAEHFGKVKALNFRYTHIKTADGRDIFIPNSDVLTKPVSNYTSDGYFRHDFIIGIGYDDDLEKSKSIIEDILANTIGVVQTDTHKSFVMEHELAASTINLKVFFWVNTIDYKVAANVLKGRIINKVITALTDEGFLLPGNITEIKMYGGQEDLPLKLRKDPRDRELDKVKKN